MFKKALLSILLIVMAIGFFPVITIAESSDYYYISYGSKEDMVSLAISYRFASSILELGFVSKSDKSIISEFDSGMGADVLYCHEIFDDQITLFIGPGMYFISNSDQSKTEFNFAYSLGIQWHIDESLGFGIGYHSIRGLSGQIIASF